MMSASNVILDLRVGIAEKKNENQSTAHFLQANLETYVQQVFDAIVYSGLNCPITMCEVFYLLREAALKHFPGQ